MISSSAFLRVVALFPLFISVLLQARVATAQMCENLFGSVLVTEKISLPAGFHLNPHLISAALSESATKATTQNLIASVKLVDTLNDELLRQISESSQDVKATTALLHKAAAGPIEPGVVDMVLAAVAEMNRGRSTFMNLRETDVDDTNVRRLIAFFKKRGTLRQLPPFQDYLQSNDFLFRMLMREIFRATTAAAMMVSHQPSYGTVTPEEARGLLETKEVGDFLVEKVEDFDRFDRRVFDALEFAEKTLGTPLTFHQKLNAAMGQAGDEYELMFEKHLRGLFDVKTIKKWASKPGMLSEFGGADILWATAGSSAINVVAIDVIEEVNGLKFQDIDLKQIRRPTVAEIEAYMRERSPAGWPHLQFTIDALAQVMYRERDILRQPSEIRERLRSGLFPIGETIRGQVKEIEGERRRQLQAAKNLAPPKEAPTIRIRNSGIRVAAVQGNLVKKTESRELEIVPLPAEIAPILPSDVKPLTSLLVAPPKAGIRYSFKFPNSHEENFVEIDASVLSELKKKQQTLSAWVSAFLNGRTANVGSNGLKTVNGMRGDVWEIKSLAVGLRIVVTQDKETKTWRWQGLVTHDRVVQFCRDRRL